MISEKAKIAQQWRNDNACKLDNEPAKVVGWGERFATVASETKAFQWSWEAVARIMAKDRQFKS